MISIYLQSASIQPRMRPVRFARSPCTDYYYQYYRSPRSRVTVKCEPFTVSPTATDKPRLVPTERFARFETVQPHRFKSTQPFPPVNPRWSQLQPAPISGHEETNSVSWTDQACGGSNCTRDDLSGSLSLDSLARIAPMLDQKSRSDHLDMLDDLDL